MADSVEWPHSPSIPDPDLASLTTNRFNRGAESAVEIRAVAIDRTTNASRNNRVENVGLPPEHDLVVAVSDWRAVDLSVRTLRFR